MSHTTKEQTALDKVLTTIKDRAADRKTRVVTLVTVTAVAATVAAYKYRHEISSWSYDQTKRVYNWFKGNNPDN